MLHIYYKHRYVMLYQLMQIIQKKVGGARCQVMAAYVTPPGTPKISKEQKYIIYIKSLKGI